MAPLARSDGWSEAIRETIRGWSWFSRLLSAELWLTDLLIRVPSAVLLHVDVDLIKDLLGLGQTPLGVVRSTETAISPVKALASTLSAMSQTDVR